jgi:uncharacterized membrane protein YjjB (DUF3815 family)
VNWYALLIAIISGASAYVVSYVLVVATGNEGKYWKSIIVAIIVGVVAYAGMAIPVAGTGGAG